MSASSAATGPATAAVSARPAWSLRLSIAPCGCGLRSARISTWSAERPEFWSRHHADPSLATYDQVRDQGIERLFRERRQDQDEETAPNIDRVHFSPRDEVVENSGENEKVL